MNETGRLHWRTLFLDFRAKWPMDANTSLFRKIATLAQSEHKNILRNTNSYILSLPGA